MQKKLKFSVTESYSYLTLFISQKMSLLIVILFVNENSYFYTHPKFIILLYGALYSKLTGHVQLSHLTKSYFNQKILSVIIIIILLPISVILVNYKIISCFTGDQFIFASLVLAILSYTHFFVFVTREISAILGIRIFRINK